MSFASQLANFSKSISNQKNRDKPQKKRQRQHYNPHEKLHTELLNLSKSIPKSSDTPNTKHISLLFLIIDNLPFEHIWESWMKKSSSEEEDYSISVLIHAKYPERVRSEWVKQHLILEEGNYNEDGTMKPLSFRPEWGSVE